MKQIQPVCKSQETQCEVWIENRTVSRVGFRSLDKETKTYLNFYMNSLIHSLEFQQSDTCSLDYFCFRFCHSADGNDKILSAVVCIKKKCGQRYPLIGSSWHMLCFFQP